AVNSFFSKFALLELRPPPSSPANQRKNRGGYPFLRPQAMEVMGVMIIESLLFHVVSLL
ncbi:hypothetical protein A2U01_0025083, partial [Trifolium medium]|nr:hypothetical protein [Trifolium medium]